MKLNLSDLGLDQISNFIQQIYCIVSVNGTKDMFQCNLPLYAKSSQPKSDLSLIYSLRML